MSARPVHLAIGLCWLVLLWPALVNGGPFLFVDTTAYVRGVDGAAEKIFDLSTAWSAPASPASRPEAVGTGVARSNASGNGDRIVLAGRSVYYGLLAYMSHWLGSFWPLAVGQALLTAVAIVLTVDRLWPALDRRWTAILLLPAALLLTPAPYFAGFVMPDMLLALGILAVANVAAFWEIDGARRRAFWIGVLVLAVLAHLAILLVALLTVAIGVLLFRSFARVPRSATLALGAALAIGIVGEVAFTLGVHGMTGHPPVRPPFLAARLVDDGPGYRYLRETCPRSGFALCRMVKRPPVNSDAFLWSTEAGVGSFLSGSTRDARDVSAEQMRFVAAVFRAKPLEVIASSLGAIGRQTAHAGLGEFNYEEGTRQHFHAKLPCAELDSVRKTAAYRGDMPTAFVAGLAPWLAMLSVAVIGTAMYARRRLGSEGGRIALLCAFVLLGVLLNIAVSGTISTPHDRYNMRALWLLPVLAAALAPRLLRLPSGRKRVIPVRHYGTGRDRSSCDGSMHDVAAARLPSMKT